jgi:uncharacterized linocin/CFP29 family protein
MNSLYRELAPVAESAWEQIETEASQTLKRTLAARKLVDFDGPYGWDLSSVDRGRVTTLGKTPCAGTEASLRRVQPLLEIRVPFELARSELEAIDRGATDADLQPVIEAARTAAMAEDTCIMYGYDDGQITGICEAAGPATLPLTDDYAHYPEVLAAALNHLRTAGIDGPYAIALGPRCYTGLTHTRDAGYPVMEHLHRLLEGPIVWAPSADGALVLSLRGGDFRLTVGQDFSIGYLDHDAERVRLYIQESFAFKVNAAEAAVPLKYL